MMLYVMFGAVSMDCALWSPAVFAQAWAGIERFLLGLYEEKGMERGLHEE